MTKDRRLGRGLAALLGTPLEEMNTATVSQTGGAKVPPRGPMPVSEGGGELDESTRADMIRRLNGQAHETAEAMRGQVVGGDVVSSRAAIEIVLALIDNNPFQPRREFNEEEIDSLAESMKEHEQLQPILVRRVGDRYQLISGERRLRAARKAGLKTIRAEVRQADDRLVAELAIIENLQRKDLNPIEKAMSFKRYVSEHHCTQEDLAKRLKIDRSTIANLMRLLELPQAILDAVQRDEVSAGHARALLPLETEEEQRAFANQIRSQGWSVRETEKRVAEELERAESDETGLTGPASRNPGRTKSDHIGSLEQEFKMALGTKVEIKQSSTGRGKIIIQFANGDEYERLRALLLGGASSNANPGVRRAA